MKSTPRLRALWLSLSLQMVTSFGKIVELLGGEALLEEMGHNVSDVLALGMHTMITCKSNSPHIQNKNKSICLKKMKRKNNDGEGIFAKWQLYKLSISLKTALPLSCLTLC